MKTLDDAACLSGYPRSYADANRDGVAICAASLKIDSLQSEYGCDLVVCHAGSRR